MKQASREQINLKDLEPLLARVEKPTRYIGGEPNAVVKDLSSVALTWAFAFPDVYELGMSNLGLQILYHILNDRADIACERVFAPWTDMEKLMRARGVPLFTLENRLRVNEADIFAFTIPYEIILSNVVNMIDLAGLPLRASARDSSAPLLLGGGAVAMNPEPIADFFDAFVIGDGEDVVLEISDTVAEWRTCGERNKDALLEALAQIEGVYVPSFFEPHYGLGGRLESIEPLRERYARPKRRIVADLDQARFPDAPIVPLIKTVHDRMSFEIARGCTQGCRFCQAGMITRPTRERSPSTIVGQIERTLDATGFEGISLSSLSPGDYSCVNSLLSAVHARVAPRMVSMSVSSLQVRSLTPELIRATVAVKRSGFTIAPEAGSQRMRDAINKNVTEDELLRSVETVFANGGKGVKLYFMCGLPGETDDDLMGIVDLAAKARAVARRHHRRPTITVSVSTFVPKPFTPYQWSGQIGWEEIGRKQALLEQGFRRHKGIGVRVHHGYTTFLEGVFTRGDRRLARALERVQRHGGKFDGWRERIRPEIWEKAFAEAGIEPKSYLRSRDVDAVLPWDMIDARVSRKFLKKEWERHCQALTVTDCRWGDCGHCGACNRETRLTTFDGQDPFAQRVQPAGEGRTYCHPEIELPNIPDSVPDDPVALQGAMPWRKVRLRYEKVGPARFIGHLDLYQMFHRALRRIGAPLRYTQGFHPTPRMVFSNPLPVGVESRVEYVDIELVDAEPHLSGPEIVEALNQGSLARGLRLIESLPPTGRVTDVESISYRIDLPSTFDEQRLEREVEAFGELDTPIHFQKKKRVIDVRPLVRALSADGTSICLELATPPTGTIKPLELLRMILPEVDSADVRVVKQSSMVRKKVGT